MPDLLDFAQALSLEDAKTLAGATDDENGRMRQALSAVDGGLVARIEQNHTKG